MSLKILKKPLLFLSSILSFFNTGCSEDPDLFVKDDSSDQTQSPSDNNASEMFSESILVFSKTAGFRHASIEKGVQLIMDLGAQNNFLVEHSEISSDINAENLSKYEVVVFLNTTGDILDANQQIIFERYIQAGGSFMGVHAAADTEYDWPWYGQLVGAYFESHSDVTSADGEIVIEDHAATEKLPMVWSRTDEWYNFRTVYEEINVLLNLDERTYQGGLMGENHPIAWYHEFDGGRSFYTGGGHTETSYDEPDFQNHLLGGILYCLAR